MIMNGVCIYVCLMMGEGVLVGIPTPKRLLPLMMGVREVEDGVLSRVSELKTTVVGGGGGDIPTPRLVRPLGRMDRKPMPVYRDLCDARKGRG